MRLIAVVIYVLLPWLTISAHAASPVITLEGRTDAPAMIGHIDWLLDPGHRFSLEDVAADGDAFQPVAGESADFGYTTDAAWLRIAVQNATTNTEWRMLVRENFFQNFDVWLVRADGAVEHLESQDELSPFSSRAIPYPELAVPFHLDERETATLVIRYWSGGSSEISFQLHTLESFAAKTSVRTARNFVYYGMMVIMIIAALAACVATRQYIFLAYGAYAFCGLMFIMHADGNAFRYLWPGAPVFNAFASIPIGTGIVVFGANYARQFLQTAEYHPIVDKLMIALMVFGVGLAASSAVFGQQPVKKLLILLSFAAVLMFTIAGLIAARKRFKEVRFYVLAWMGAVVSAGIMTSRHWLGLEISEEVQFDSIRIVLVSDAAFMGLAILDRFNQMKRAQQKALEASLTEANRNLQLSTRLQELEERYAMARQLSDQKDRKLANTVHDLRTPLHALRLNVQAMMQGGGAAPKSEDVEQTFTYLEQLVGRELDAQVAGEAAKLRTDPAPTAHHALDPVLSQVREMFQPDAEAKGLDLRVVPTSFQVPVPPFVIMRLLSNLVSNAIKYTEAGRVVVGVRRDGDGLRLEVHDTGRGLSPVEFARLTARAVRAEDADDQAEGSGLGLDIVNSLSAEHGLELGLVDGRKNGTGVYLRFPSAS